MSQGTLGLIMNIVQCNAFSIQMDGSRGTSVGDDSEFEDLVAEGREEHPIVRYTRLVRDKKAELEYVYNPVRQLCMQCGNE